MINLSGTLVYIISVLLCFLSIGCVDTKQTELAEKVISEYNYELKFPNSNKDAQWFFNSSNLGLFIHWGIHSVDGIQPSWAMMENTPWEVKGKYEAYQSENRNKYYDLAKEFNPNSYNPDKWMKAAKEAGFTYAVITAKHHDGYALWPSTYGDFNTGKFMDGRDLIEDYVIACRKYGLKVGLYFSPRDWSYKNFPVTFDYTTPFDYSSFSESENQLRFKKFYNYTLGQLKELLTNYGKIDLLWFDGLGWDKLTDDYGVQTYNWIRKLQPGIVINDRWSKTVNPDLMGKGKAYLGDYKTFEISFPDQKPDDKWEFCTIAAGGHWGYNPNADYISFNEFWKVWKNINKWEGNFLLNFGPSADGEMPEAFYDFCDTLRMKNTGTDSLFLDK